MRLNNRCVEHVSVHRSLKTQLHRNVCSRSIICVCAAHHCKVMTWKWRVVSNSPQKLWKTIENELSCASCHVLTWGKSLWCWAQTTHVNPSAVVYIDTVSLPVWLQSRLIDELCVGHINRERWPSWWSLEEIPSPRARSRLGSLLRWTSARSPWTTWMEVRCLLCFPLLSAGFLGNLTANTLKCKISLSKYKSKYYYVLVLVVAEVFSSDGVPKPFKVSSVHYYN